jgi:hypothetical protein
MSSFSFGFLLPFAVTRDTFVSVQNESMRSPKKGTRLPCVSLRVLVLAFSFRNNSFRRGDSIAEATNTEKVANVDYVARIMAHMSPFREAELDSRRFRWQTF